LSSTRTAIIKVVVPRNAIVTGGRRRKKEKGKGRKKKGENAVIRQTLISEVQPRPVVRDGITPPDGTRKREEKEGKRKTVKSAICVNLSSRSTVRPREGGEKRKRKGGGGGGSRFLRHRAYHLPFVISPLKAAEDEKS